VWASTPPAGVIFPTLGKIVFKNEAEFGSVAAKYLSDEKLRRQTAEEMRDIVVARFSYDARWAEFLAGITAGMKASAACP
jgi:spore maturation protein CgeB